MYELAQTEVTGGIGMAQQQTLTERLEGQKASLEARLREIDAVLYQLESNPEMQNILDSLARIGHTIY